MKKLQPVLDLLNTLVVEHIRVHFASLSDQALGVSSQISRIDLKAGDLEGVTLENLVAAVESVQLPSPGDLNLYATLFLDQVDLLLSPNFWPRAARLAREAIVGKLGILADRVEVRGVRIRLCLSPEKRLNLSLEMASCQVKLMGQLMVDVAALKLKVAGLDLQEKDRKKALKEAAVRLEDLQIRVYELTMNRAVEVIRDKLPSKARLNALDIALSERTMRVTVKTGYLPMSIPIELQMSTQNNLFGIYIVKIFVGLARPLILKAVQTFAASKPEVSASGDNLWIDPWIKIPLAIQCRVETFNIEGGALRIGFGSLPEESPTEEETVVAAESA